MDLVVGKEAITNFLFEDDNGKYRFCVLNRFALRLKDKTAVIRFDFNLNAS